MGMEERMTVWKAVSQLKAEIMDDVKNSYKWVVWDERCMHKVIGWSNRLVGYDVIDAVPSKYHVIELENGLVFRLQRVFTGEGGTGIEGLSFRIIGEYKISKKESVEYLWRLISRLQERIWRLEDIIERLREEVKKRND